MRVVAAIGALADAVAMLRGEAGTIISGEGALLEWGTAPLLSSGVG